MSNDDLKVRVEIMRALGVQSVKDGDLEIVMFPTDEKPDVDPAVARARAERHQFGGK